MISLYPVINDFFEICLIVANGSIKIATHNLESSCLCKFLLLLLAKLSVISAHFICSAFSHLSVAKKVHFTHSIRAGFTLLFVRHSFFPHFVVCFPLYCDFSNRMLMFSFFEARVLPCLVKFLRNQGAAPQWPRGSTYRQRRCPCGMATMHAISRYHSWRAEPCVCVAFSGHILRI